MVESQFKKFKEDKLRVLLALETEELLQPQGETMQLVKLRPRNSAWFKEKLMLVEAQEAAKVVLMANLSSCDSNVISEVPYSDTYPDDMINQDVQEMPYYEQTHIVDFLDNDTTSDSNIIPYSQYLQESQDAVLWLKHSNHTFDTSIKSHTPVRIEAPSELPKVSLVNESLKKLKYHLANFDKVVKKRTTSDAITACAWGFEHTKACFLTEIIPFIKVLKDIFNAFDKTLLDEITKVQNVFNQMEAAVDQCSVDKKDLEIQINQLRIDNDKLLNQIMSQEILHIAVNSVDILDMPKSCVDECNKCLELETELLKKKDMIEKDVYDKLVKSYSTLEKHCISLELTTQLNQFFFQKDNYGENQNGSTFNQLFEINELKAQSQEKDTVISKLKDRFKSLSGKESVEKVKKDIDEIETINIELEHKHSDSLIAQINAKSVENSDLNAQFQEKVFAIAALKNELRKLKGKNIVDTAVSTPIAITIALGMFKLDIKPISHRLKNNRDAYEDYLKKTIENTNTLCGLELLVYVSKTCPSLQKPSEKLVAITPLNKDKKVRFADPLTSSRNTQKLVDSNIIKDSNKPLLHSTRVKCSTSASGSKPSGNMKNNRISQPSCSNKTNKVEDQSRSVNSRKNKKNHVDKTKCTAHVRQSMLNANSVSEPISNALVKHSVKNAKFEYICAICSEFLFDVNHDMCLIDYVNVRSKSKSKRNKKRKVWKPTGKLFTEIGYSWKPTGRTFTIVGNRCPLTRITSTKVVPTKETTNKSVLTPTQGIIDNNRRSKAPKLVGSSSKSKITKSRISKSLDPTQSGGSIVSNVPSSSLIDCSKFLGTVRFGNDHIAKIMGYGDCQMGNVTISRVYYVEGLGHNLFLVGQFCDSDLEVAFHKHTCFIRDLEGVDLLKGSRGSNLYTLSLDNFLLSSLICLLSKASKTKSWLLIPMNSSLTP
ncbi:hypothetical protein Tco_0562028 [Tanacetum coccineum]